MGFSTLSMGGEDGFVGVDGNGVREKFVIILIRSETLDSAFLKRATL